MTTRKSERVDNNFEFVSDKRDLITFNNLVVPKELRGKKLMIKIEVIGNGKKNEL